MPPGTALEHILYGHDPTPGIVAVEPAGRFFRIFVRDEQGVAIHDHPFTPFMFVHDCSLLGGAALRYTQEPLSGTGYFRYLIRFESWQDCRLMGEYLQKETVSHPGGDSASFLFWSDRSHQFLMMSGMTMFKGIDTELVAVLVLELDFEQNWRSGHEPRLTACAIADTSGFTRALSGSEMSETEMILCVTQAIAEQDPDLIINSHRTHHRLAMLARRAQQLGIVLGWGRNGTSIRVGHVSGMTRSASVDQDHVTVYGRSVLCLSELEQHIEHDSCPQEAEPGNLLELADASLRRYRLLAPGWYLKLQMAPYSYQSIVQKNSIQLVNALMLRAYLRTRHAVPRPQPCDSLHDENLLDLFPKGIQGPVIQCSLTLLNTAILQTYRIAPASDELNLFLPLLATIKNVCLKSETDLLQSGRTAALSVYHQQVTELLQAFYSLLGAGHFTFSDGEAATELARIRRVIIKDMRNWLHELACKPVEIGAGSFYVVPPPGSDGCSELETLSNRLAALLPSGIKLHAENRYRSMLTTAPRNHALLGLDGRLRIKGSSLKTTGTEPYLKDYLQDLLRLVLEGKPEAAPALQQRYLATLAARRFLITWLAHAEYLHETPDQYREHVRQGKRHRSAAYELALASGGTWQPGDGIRFYVTGSSAAVKLLNNVRLMEDYDPSRPDVNIAWYAERLRQLHQRLEPHFFQQPTLFD